MNFETFLAETNKLNETLQADLAVVDVQIIALAESKSEIINKSNEAAQALAKEYGDFIEAENKKAEKEAEKTAKAAEKAAKKAE